MRHGILAMSLSIIIVASMSLCISGVALADDSQATAEGVSEVVKSSNQFAFDLLSNLTEEGNIFFSPFSITTALAMTYEGARGDTASEMKNVLYLPDDIVKRTSSFARIYNLANRPGKEYELDTANALWAEKEYKFLDEYFGNVTKYYGGNVNNMDFKTEPDKSRITINNWVSDQTKGKIKDLLPPSSIGPATRLVLTNAIYFKGVWEEQFKKENTRDQDFKVSADETVKVPMMSMSGKDFNYTENDDMQVLEMSYKGNDVSMIIFLPKNDIASIEKYLNAKDFESIRESLRTQEVNVRIPKFTFETKYFLPETLKSMGMKKAFDPINADFSGMDGSRMLFISDVIHQAFVDVNEEGTEAAAATAVVIVTSSARLTQNFVANHPFIFMIQERSMGEILFLGKVLNPASK